MHTPSLFATATLASAASALAPLHLAFDRAAAVPEQYIVKFHHDRAITQDIQDLVDVADFVYESPGFRGFAGKLDSDMLDALQASHVVDFIEEDVYSKAIHSVVTQKNATWGLARFSHRKHSNSTEFTYDDSAGEGTCAYVLDSGVRVDHSEFDGGRATFLRDFGADGSDSDILGHGTHVAGILGGKTFGQAKKTSIFSVKIMDWHGSGTAAQAIAGMDFVVNDSPDRDCPNGIVVNMSVGYDRSKAVNAAAAAMVDAGIFVAVSAGNDQQDVAMWSPASEPSVCTVGATNRQDKVAYFSNWGKGVDIFAPGVGILSSYPFPVDEPGPTYTQDGTSMSAPAIAGLGAYLLALEGPTDPVSLCSRIQELATEGILTGVHNNTANLLAYNGIDTL